MIAFQKKRKEKKKRETPCGLRYQENNPVSWRGERQKGLLG